MKPDEIITVAIVEDNKQLRPLLESMIQSHDGFACNGIFANGEAALEALPELLPDVVLMDIGLPGISGIECVRRLKPVCPGVEFMMCTVYDEDEKIFEALEAGANAYILKSTGPAELLAAIQSLHSGGSPMSPDIARKVVQRYHRRPAEMKDLFGITPREEEILALLAGGLLYKEVADKLGISVKTTKKHIYNIYEKMHVHNKVEAVNIYLRK